MTPFHLSTRWYPQQADFLWPNSEQYMIWYNNNVILYIFVIWESGQVLPSATQWRTWLRPAEIEPGKPCKWYFNSKPMIFRYCSYCLLAEIGPLDPAIWSFVDVYEFLIRAWHLLLQLNFKVFSLRNSTASKFTTLSLCIQDIFRWVMQQLLCSICSKSFFAFVLMEHSPKSVKVAWMWISPTDT